jgi:hypothetical protein
LWSFFEYKTEHFTCREWHSEWHSVWMHKPVSRHFSDVERLLYREQVLGLGEFGRVGLPRAACPLPRLGVRQLSAVWPEQEICSPPKRRVRIHRHREAIASEKITISFSRSFPMSANAGTKARCRSSLHFVGPPVRGLEPISPLAYGWRAGACRCGSRGTAGVAVQAGDAERRG